MLLTSDSTTSRMGESKHTNQVYDIKQEKCESDILDHPQAINLLNQNMIENHVSD